MKILIMAGGKGTRFWPRSLETKPKQFLALTSEETMIQQTYRRFLQWLPQTSIYVVAPRQYMALIREQLPELEQQQIIVEPEQRDTGPCIALSAHHFLERGDDEVLVTTPSDQYIPDADALWQALLQAEQVALKDRSIVTLGIVPTRPETGYGYIAADPDQRSGPALRVQSFIEKPSAEKAQALVERSHIYWNSGIFIWKPSTIAHCMREHQGVMWNKLTQSYASLEDVYAALPKISVDYAILEKAETIYTIPVHFAWDDVGSWTSLERVFPQSAQGNITIGAVNADKTVNSILYSDHQKMVVIGVRDLIVVSTKEGLLVCHKSQEQHIKTMLNSLDSEEAHQ